MIVVKYIGLLLIFISTSGIGVLISKKYSSRVKELTELKNSLNIFKTKIKFTYEPIPDIFSQISGMTNENISKIFIEANEKMKDKTAGQAWIEAIDDIKSKLNLNEEDINVIKGLSKLLGKTDIDGQISEIELTSSFIDVQIEKAERDRIRNEKLYKTLGMITGLTIVIILI